AQWRSRVAARPSRSDLALDGHEHSGSLQWEGMIRGELAVERGVRATNLYSVDPRGSHHDAVMRIGGETPRRRAHSKTRVKDHVQCRVAASSVHYPQLVM